MPDDRALPPSAALNPIAFGSTEPNVGKRAVVVPPVIMAAGAIFAILMVGGILGGFLLDDAANKTNLLMRMGDPSLGLFGQPFQPFGSDQLGRDVFLRTIKAIQVSIGISLAGVVGGCLIGTAVGLAAGYFGGWVDRTSMVVVDLQIAIPNLLIILTGIALFGTSLVVLVAMISLARWEGYARLVRSLVLQAREADYIEAVRALGGGPVRIVMLHILPNIAAPLVVMITMSFPSVLLMESSLSFLGIGVQPPTPSLGRLVTDGRDLLATAPWVCLGPAFVMVALTMSGQIVADWLRDRLDARLEVV